MRVSAWGASGLAAPVALLLALVYSQVGWRSDRKAYVELLDRFHAIRLQGTFPSDGQDLAASALSVIEAGEPVPLARVVRGRRAVIYFERPDCFICVRFGEVMDSILPAWRDSLVVVRTHDKKGSEGSALMLDSASSRMVTGVPAMLVIDSAGFVRHSVPAGLPEVIQVLDFVGLPSPRQMLFERVQDTTRAGREG